MKRSPPNAAEQGCNVFVGGYLAAFDFLQPFFDIRRLFLRKLKEFGSRRFHLQEEAR